MAVSISNFTRGISAFSSRLEESVDRVLQIPEKKKKGSPNKKLAEILIDPLVKEEEGIKTREENIARTLRSLRAERKKLTQRKKVLFNKKKGWEKEKEKITAEVKEIKEKLPVRVMRVVKEKQPTSHPIILIETLMLSAKPARRSRRIGNYLIRIDPFARNVENKIRIANLWKRVFNNDENSAWYDHPCISNSKLCFGNTRDDFSNLLREREIFGLVELTIDFLRTNKSNTPYIAWDPWFKQIRPLPEKVELFPDRNYALIDEKEEGKDYLALEQLTTNQIYGATLSSWSESTSFSATTVSLSNVEWEEYAIDADGRIREFTQRMMVPLGTEDSDQAEIDALRNRIKNLSKELVDLKMYQNPTDQMRGRRIESFYGSGVIGINSDIGYNLDTSTYQPIRTTSY